MSIQNTFAPIAAAASLFACAASPEAAAQNTGDAPRTITVTGQGSALAAPDMAIISIGVQTQGDTAAAALRQNSTEMAATIKKLKSLGIADRDLQTSGLSVNPRYNYDKNRSNPEIVGFNASNMITVRLRDLDKAGRVIDQAVQSGANSLGGISFTFADPQPLQEKARKDAVAKARANAELLTEAAGVDLGPVLTIQDGYVSAPSPRPMAARMESADMAVPIQAGEAAVTATVSIVYQIN